MRPTFLFLSREKKKRAAPGTKKKSAGSGFRGESCSFFVRALRPENGFPGAMRTGLPLAPLPLTGADGLAFMLKNLAFHWKTAASYGDRDTVWQG